MKGKVVKLDVRPDLERGVEPFSKIMQTVARLRNNDALLLTAPFEPVPLFAVLRRLGYSHKSKPMGTGNWEVLFQREVVLQSSEESPAPRPVRQPLPVVEVDARGLEPPQPMVTILEALAQLPPCAELRARTDCRPVHLFPRLAERGFTAESQEQADGSFVTHIRSC
jgi:TusA-related sulfurtransferase